MEEKQVNENVVLESGKVYTLYDFKPEETVATIIPKEGADVIAMAQEIITLAKYSDNQEVFSNMVLRALNTNLTSAIRFPKARVEEVAEVVTGEVE